MRLSPFMTREALNSTHLKSCSQTWADRGHDISVSENYFETILMAFTSIFCIYALFQVVVVRKVRDVYAITIPISIMIFALMMGLLYISQGFKDYEDMVDQKRLLRTYWYMCAFYGAYHWLFAIQYLQSSLILKIFHLEVQNRRKLLQRTRRWLMVLNIVVLSVIIGLAPLLGVLFSEVEDGKYLFEAAIFRNTTVTISLIVFMVALCRITRVVRKI